MAAKAEPGRKRTTATRARTRRSKAAADWAPAFLAAFAETGNITHACKLANVGRSTVYERRDSDAGFRDLMAEAAQDAADALELEARRRALFGVEEPVVGRVGGRDGDDEWLLDPTDPEGERRLVIRRYSDSLLMFLLKANRPEKYRERHEVRHITEDAIDAEIRRLSAELEREGLEDPKGAA